MDDAPAGYPPAPAPPPGEPHTAALLAVDDPEITALLLARRLKKITGLRALKTPGVVFVRVRPGRRITSYGIGVSPFSLLRDLTRGACSVETPWDVEAGPRAP